jgi:hypothetical protein
MLKINLSILLLAGFAFQPTAQAAINWDFTPPNSYSPIYADYSTTRATVTAFATNGTSNTSSLLVSAQANAYGGGLGINHTAVNECPDPNNCSPNHAIDNNNGFEFALFSFKDIATGVNVAATLNSLAIGWNNNGDADVSVLAYTGSGTPTLTGKNLSSNSSGLLGSGWSLVANLSNMGTGDGNARTFNTSTPKSSSYWLIGGYFGNESGNLTKFNDYFKISGLGGTFTPPPGSSNDPVPEPSSLVMLSLALLGWRRYVAGSKHSMAF